MALFGSRKDAEDWSNAPIQTTYPEDLFECKDCKIEFGLESSKIKGKNVVCPICLKNLKPWCKNR
jgi:hypothetical protein